MQLPSPTIFFISVGGVNCTSAPQGKTPFGPEYLNPKELHALCCHCTSTGLYLKRQARGWGADIEANVGKHSLEVLPDNQSSLERTSSSSQKLWMEKDDLLLSTLLLYISKVELLLIWIANICALLCRSFEVSMVIWFPLRNVRNVPRRVE